MTNEQQHYRTNPQGVPVISPAPIAGTKGTPSHMRAEQRRRRGRAPLIVLGVFVVLVVAVYAAGAVAFSQICYPHTHIADTDVSLMDRATAAQRVRTSAKSYRLAVMGDGFTWNYEPENPEDIIDADAVVDRVISAMISSPGRFTCSRR